VNTVQTVLMSPKLLSLVVPTESSTVSCRPVRTPPDKQDLRDKILVSESKVLSRIYCSKMARSLFMFPAEPSFKGDDLKHEVLTAATGSSSMGVTSMIVVGAGSISGA